MQIPDPVVNFGDECEVLNYCCRPARWERGKVVEVNYENKFGSASWSYAVYVLRSGRVIYVADGQVRKYDGGE